VTWTCRLIGSALHGLSVRYMIADCCDPAASVRGSGDGVLAATGAMTALRAEMPRRGWG